MIVQEDIVCTREEFKAVVKTIKQLRREKKELIENACEFLYQQASEGNLECRNIDKLIKDFRKVMEGEE